jgi:PIN domain nuclease of toxin-antitoxin system
VTQLLAVDSSVLLTWILQERRWQLVERLLDNSELDVVLPEPGLAEVIAIARKKGNASSPQQLATAMAARGVRIEPLAPGDALRAAELLEISALKPGPVGRHSGRPMTLSLGDALILSVVERLGCPVLSRDGYWQVLSTEGHTTAVVLPLQ